MRDTATVPALVILAVSAAAAIGCTTRPNGPTAVTPKQPPDSAIVDTGTSLPPGFVGAAGRLAYTFDTLRSAADSGAPPAWVCAPSSGTIADTVPLSSIDTMPAGSATLLALQCQANRDSVSGSSIDVLLIADSTPVVLTASSTKGEYRFAYHWHGTALSFLGHWTNAADTAMAGDSARLVLIDGHVLSGSWAALRK